MICIIHGEKRKCEVTENMGYQNGRYVKAVEYEGKEYIVIKDGKLWRTVDPIEKLRPVGHCVGQ
jgi:hypothetical protein